MDFSEVLSEDVSMVDGREQPEQLEIVHTRRRPCDGVQQDGL